MSDQQRHIKLKSEQDAASTGVTVQVYRTDNGVYTSNDFLDKLAKNEQVIQFSDVGGHHQNEAAKNAIKKVLCMARTMMIYAALSWPEHADKKLWPLGLQHAVFIYNHTPRMDNGLSPEEIWTGVKVKHSRLLNSYPSGDKADDSSHHPSDHSSI